MRSRILILSLLTCISPLAAQEAPAPAGGGQTSAPTRAPGLKVRGLAFQLPNTPADVYAHDAATDGSTPGVKLDVKSYLNHEFSVLPIKGSSLILTKTADPAGIKDAGNVLAKVKLPSKFKTGIFMFLPGSGKAGDTPFRVLVIEDGKSDFPPGSVKVMNLSPQPIRIQLEKEYFNFKSGETKVIEDPPVAENQSSGMRAFSFEDGDWRRFASGVWPHPGRKRVLQVMFLNPTSKRVEIRGIRDVAAIVE